MYNAFPLLPHPTTRFHLAPLPATRCLCFLLFAAHSPTPRAYRVFAAHLAFLALFTCCARALARTHTMPSARRACARARMAGLSCAHALRLAFPNHPLPHYPTLPPATTMPHPLPTHCSAGSAYLPAHPHLPVMLCGAGRMDGQDCSLVWTGWDRRELLGFW